MSNGQSLLIVMYSLTGGGAEKVASDLANSFALSGVRVRFVTLDRAKATDWPLIESVERRALNLVRPHANFLMNLTGNIIRVKALRGEFKNYKPDVVLSFITETNILAILASLNASHRIVVSERGYPEHEPVRLIWKRIRKYIYRTADAVVVQTKAVQIWVEQECSVVNSVVIPNMVSLPLPGHGPIVSPSSVVGVGDNVLLSVSQLRPQKGVDKLIRIFHDLPQLKQNWKLVICGSGEQEAELKNLVTSLGMDGQVYIIGRVGNTEEWYRRAGIFALTSESEGFPNALLEAMACGCPVISYDCDAGPRDIINSDNGILVGNQNHIEFREKLSGLMKSHATRKDLGEISNQVLQKYHPDLILEQWQRVLWPHLI